MRVSRVQAEANKQRVIDEASRLFRAHGYDGIGLKDLMQAAGLTQGGFYKQFASKDDLAAQATARALAGSSARWIELVETNPQAPLRALVDFYLAPAHRDARDRGCPLAALGSDAPRHAAAVNAAFDSGIRSYLDVVGTALGEEGRQAPSADAMVTLSTMVGALMLARMTADGDLSDRILEAARLRLESDGAGGDRSPGDSDR